MRAEKGEHEAHMWDGDTCLICAVHRTWRLAAESCVRVSVTPGEYRIAMAKYRRRQALMGDAAE